MLHDVLWESNTDLAKACLRHPIVQGLAAGSLDPEAFKRYVAQDAFFLEAFLRAYALAAAKCESLQHIRTFHTLMGGAFEELKLHAVHSKKLNIDLTNVRPYPQTSAYTNFLLRTAWHCGAAEIVAAMGPCMRLYAYLGTELAPYRRPDHPYHEWISMYSSDDFQSLAKDVDSLLDALAEDSSEVRDAYRYAMQCELEFFSAPLEKTP